eukprot:1178521-Amphidinium_carterae.1
MALETFALAMLCTGGCSGVTSKEHQVRKLKLYQEGALKTVTSALFRQNSMKGRPCRPTTSPSP